jgi:group I intron endonuclease
MNYSQSGVYQILNKVNGKVYIGSSVTVHRRITTHKRHLLLNKHVNEKLQFAYNKYGIDNFEYSVLEYCDKDVLLETEQKYLDTLDIQNNYNILPVAGNTTGYKWTDETRVKIEAIIPERSKKISLALTGYKHTEETKAKVSAAGKGKLRSEETKQRMRKPKSDTHKANISKGQTGMKHTPERVQNIKDGKRKTLEAKEGYDPAYYTPEAMRERNNVRARIRAKLLYDKRKAEKLSEQQNNALNNFNTD